MGDDENEHRAAKGRNFTYALRLVYDGERYLGFQYQPPPCKTVQARPNPVTLNPKPWT